MTTHDDLTHIPDRVTHLEQQVAALDDVVTRLNVVVIDLLKQNAGLRRQQIAAANKARR